MCDLQMLTDDQKQFLTLIADSEQPILFKELTYPQLKMVMLLNELGLITAHKYQVESTLTEQCRLTERGRVAVGQNGHNC